MQHTTLVTKNKPLIVKHQQTLRTDADTLEYERQTRQLENINQELIRVRAELARYKGLHEDTASKTSHMKDTINQLVNEIEKLNDLITQQDIQINSLNNRLAQMTQYCEEQKSEKIQLLKFLQQYQQEHQASAQIEQAQAQEIVLSRTEQLEKELLIIKSSYEKLTEMHQQEVNKLKQEINEEKKRVAVSTLQQKITLSSIDGSAKVSHAIDQLEKQLAIMEKLLDQKQDEIDNLKQGISKTELENQVEELQGQVLHFKELHRQTVQEFAQYRHNAAQKDVSLFSLEQTEQQLLGLKRQISFLEDQNQMLRQTHEDQQINNLLKDLSALKTENEKLKERVRKVNQLEAQLLELSQELKKCKERERQAERQIREASPAREEVSDDRISGLLSVVQSLQVKNEQLQQYLSNDYTVAPFRPPHQQNTVTVRKELNNINQRHKVETALTFSPSRQLFHRSTPNVNLRVHRE